MNFKSSQEPKKLFKHFTIYSNLHYFSINYISFFKTWKAFEIFWKLFECFWKLISFVKTWKAFWFFLKASRMFMKAYKLLENLKRFSNILLAFRMFEKAFRKLFKWNQHFLNHIQNYEDLNLQTNLSFNKTSGFQLLIKNFRITNLCELFAFISKDVSKTLLCLSIWIYKCRLLFIQFEHF